MRVAAQITSDERFDLLALGKAWKARALVEQHTQAPEAEVLIQQALEDVVRRSPWIRVRISYAAGDIALKQGDNVEALKHFTSAAEALEKYGGEGGGYQIKPRLGMALLGVDVAAAEREFEDLRDLRGIPVGNLYGIYGLALVAYKRGQRSRAETLVEEALQQLKKNATSNLLWRLFDDLYSKLKREAA